MTDKLTIDHGSISLACKPETIQLFVDRTTAAKVARETEQLRGLLRDGTQIVVALASIRERTFDKVSSGAWLDRVYDSLALTTAPAVGHDASSEPKPNPPNAVAVREALAELVRLEDLRDEIYMEVPKMDGADAAWERARALLEETK